LELKRGTIPLKRTELCRAYQRDNNDQVVVTKLNRASLEAIAKATKGGYVNGNNTKIVLEYIKTLDKIQKTEFESTQIADFQSQFQWFLESHLCCCFRFLLVGRKNWVRKLNLFNEGK
jgi:Ca-activated chloride channel family protein